MEKRLIDANALCEAVDKSDRENFHKGVANRSIHHYEHIHFMKMVLDAPTVDAVEVVHGRWEAAGFDGHGDYKECCSNCKSWSIGDDKLYCPVCGAKMDG